MATKQQTSSDIHKRWLANDKKADPIFKSAAAEKKIVDLLKATPKSLYPIQPPKCSEDRYFPSEAKQYGLVRFVPSKRSDLEPSNKRGVKCKDGLQCHGRECVPAFAYT
jgi:hypothetical protein